MTVRLKISTRDELIAAVPHLLGFHPTESAVIMSLDGGPCARMDLPEPGDDLNPWLTSLTEPYLRPGLTSDIALLTFSQNPALANECLRRLLDELTPGPFVRAAISVNGDDWTDIEEALNGTVPQSVRDRFAAEAVGDGQALPLSSRAELSNQLRGNPAGVARLLPSAQRRFANLDRTERDAEATWVHDMVETYVATRVPLTDNEAARMLAALPSGPVRDTAWVSTTRPTARIRCDFWEDLTRRAPDGVRDHPAAILGFTAWVAGDGARAWTAIDVISDRSHPLARITAEALAKAVNPRVWDQALNATESAGLQRNALNTLPPERPSPSAATPGADRPGPTP